MTSPFLQIEKLDERNYDSWHVHMKSVLVHNGLWIYANGQLNFEPEWNAAQKAEWITNDEKALATIVLSIKGSQLNYIKKCTKSAEAWNKLAEVHKPRGPIQKVMLFKRLMNMKMDEGEDMSQYLNKFQDVIERLADVGIELHDELTTIILLSSLQKWYEPFIIAMETRDVLPSFHVLKLKLLEEGDRRGNKYHEAEASESQQAYGAGSKAKNLNKKEAKWKERGTKGNKKVFGKCFNCGRKGHYARDCEEKKNSDQKTCALIAAANGFKPELWYIDSGATSHMCNNSKLFKNLEKCNEKIFLAADEFITAKGKGEVIIDAECEIRLQNVLFAPELQGNFISISKAVETGCTATFTSDGVQIKDSDGDVVIKAIKNDSLFILNQKSKNSIFAASSNDVLWHCRYGHLNFDDLSDMSKNGMVNGMQISKKVRENSCKTCMVSKIHVMKFPKATECRAEKVLELVHSDVCGPIKTTSVGGSKYFVTFIDDKTRRVIVYFMKSKDEVFEKFKVFKQQVECQTGEKIKILRSDNGREYINNNFNVYLQEHGILRQLTVAYTPQQNGVAERANRTLVEMSRSMLLHAQLSSNLWAEAIATAAYLRNRSPTKALPNKTPYEAWFGRKPKVNHFKVFGSYAVALNKRPKQKFDAKGKQYVMVGYSLTAKAYRLYDKQSNKVIESRDVKFDENTFDNFVSGENSVENSCDDVIIFNYPEIQGNSQSISVEAQEINAERGVCNEIIEENVNNLDEIRLREENSDVEIASQVVPKRGSGRPKIIRDGKPGRPRKQYNIINGLLAKLDFIPQTPKEAINSEGSTEWKNAMQIEFHALKKNNTWEMVDLPSGKKAIGCKWVYAIKTTKDGEIERYKARLVAKGCSQKYGVNYLETFSPVIRYENIRLLCAIAVNRRMHLHQIDIVSAYLNGDLNEEVYMQQPELFVDEKNPKKVLRLRKSLYGLKQSGREWNAKLNLCLKKIGLKNCENEPCLYKMKVDNNLVILAVYVDDILIGCRDKSIIQNIKFEISKEFDVIDKGPVQHFIGIEINREGETGDLTMSNKQYIKNLLKKYNMEECKKTSVPLDPGFQVGCENDCIKANVTAYQTIMGELMYLAITTRPDILHSVAKLSQRNINPHLEHMNAAKNILRYLSGTTELKIMYKRGQTELYGYADADWGGNSVDRKSYSGFMFYYGKCLVSWESKKQSVVALSSTEAEYVSLSNAAKEAIYLKRLLSELECIEEIPVVLNVDNQGAMKLASNAIFHNRSKHIDIKYHHIREVINQKQISLKYLSTDNMIADIFTKNLSRIKHMKFVELMNIN